jgi:hypothetical protein
MRNDWGKSWADVRLEGGGAVVLGGTMQGLSSRRAR